MYNLTFAVNSLFNSVLFTLENRNSSSSTIMTAGRKVVIVGGGPVGALAALYVARRGYQVDLYELRDGQSCPMDMR